MTDILVQSKQQLINTINELIRDWQMVINNQTLTDSAKLDILSKSINLYASNL